MEPAEPVTTEKKEIQYSFASSSGKSEKKSNKSRGDPKYGCLKNGSKPTFKQFTRRSSLEPRPPPETTKVNQTSTTYKHYRRFGKIHNNTVRVLLPDQKTVNGIERDRKKLEKHTLTTVCDYLAKRNLYTAGSDVPEDILRETYRNAHLAGNVQNHDSDIMINNFMKKGMDSI